MALGPHRPQAADRPRNARPSGGARVSDAHRRRLRRGRAARAGAFGRDLPLLARRRLRGRRARGGLRGRCLRQRIDDRRRRRSHRGERPGGGGDTSLEPMAAIANFPLADAFRPRTLSPMTVDVAIDTELLKREIKKTYAAVSQEPGTDFIFPTGRAWAEDLGYPPELAAVPDAAAESFAGVANPFSLGRLQPGERVLDLGCGAGTDSLVAVQMVGPEGHVTGIDMTPEMLAKARSAGVQMGAGNVDF